MDHRRSTSFSPEVDLARSDARGVQSRFPFFFDQIRVPVVDLARALGLRIEERDGLQQRAQLEIFTTGDAQESAIILRPGMDQNVRRFAIAHEIGHFVLFKERSLLFRAWDTERREKFANWFASELLLSPEGRAKIEESFRRLSDPLDLLRLASSVGLSPLALLTQVTVKRPMTSGLTKIWLRVRHVENAVTHSEPRLRIVGAYYDRDRFFIPKNQSLRSFAGGDTWLSSLPIGISSRQKSTVVVKLRRSPELTPKYVPMKLQAEISAVRLAPSTQDQGSVFILVAEFEGGGPNLIHSAEDWVPQVSTLKPGIAEAPSNRG
jgi:Zn-dependent peptidase ImmA (M78 family)